MCRIPAAPAAPAADASPPEKLAPASAPVPCVFQDPVFTSADRDFIAGLGHHVVDSPVAFDCVTPDSFLFGIHLYRPVYVAALQSHLPALFVGTGLDIWDQ